ncbi:hypothetical protein Mal15_07720 [Stieleria maiorica]|uniref:Uncharacterized protein n=1 Tax=Stieleria maiorica TaxID=2795974 RepID=A0A5B9M6L7_9BACT|nr:hypothetical protein Mal15_07720 [Stieleria maiorica]
MRTTAVRSWGGPPVLLSGGGRSSTNPWGDGSLGVKAGNALATDALGTFDLGILIQCRLLLLPF